MKRSIGLLKYCYRGRLTLLRQAQEEVKLLNSHVVKLLNSHVVKLLNSHVVKLLNSHVLTLSLSKGLAG
ncbi:MAG: hypothetical protein IIB67_11525 [Proteobacteria bacterium]|nr:hypothetical protein [Pseudomonadota bacterium]